MIHAILRNDITVRDASHEQKRAIGRALTINNPAYDDALRAGRSTWNIPSSLEFFHGHGDNLTIPRGFCAELARMIPGIHWDDQRFVLPEVGFEFGGQLEAISAKPWRPC